MTQTIFLEKCYRQVSSGRNYVLLETTRVDRENYQSFFFSNPLEILTVYSPEELPGLFLQIEKALAKGYYLAGFLHYECGYHFIELEPVQLAGRPLAWFGVYRKPLIFNHRAGNVESGSPESSFPGEFKENFHFTGFRFSITETEYLENIRRIKDYIRRGDTYQINFTGKYHFKFDGSDIGLYHSLKQKQRVAYGGFIRTEDQVIISSSPELFFRIEGHKICTRPMKGTIRRGKTLAEDAEMVNCLQRDEKCRAENVMIVDLLRNDLSKVCEYGSVKTPALFSVEKYQTLFQMTSTVEGKLRKNWQFYHVFEALFPCGSVTGAPKRRSMEIIRKLEQAPRGVYCGTIGYISPARTAVFNVPIRTIVLDGTRGQMGSGSGIVWDSDAREEYRECELKAQFLIAKDEPFELIETLLWDGEYRLLDKHWQRLSSSAAYFDYPLVQEEFYSLLTTCARKFKKGQKYRVRILLNQSGEFLSESVEFPSLPFASEEKFAKVMIADIRTNSSDRFLFHKTTRRKVYNEMHQKAVQAGFSDVIFMNEKGEITEGAISNIVIKVDDVYYTPPLKCGLLNGVYRQHLLEMQPKVEERVLYLDDLNNAEAIFICNAVRGIRTVKLKRI